MKFEKPRQKRKKRKKIDDKDIKTQQPEKQLFKVLPVKVNSLNFLFIIVDVFINAFKNTPFLFQVFTSACFAYLFRINQFRTLIKVFDF